MPPPPQKKIEIDQVKKLSKDLKQKLSGKKGRLNNFRDGKQTENNKIWPRRDVKLPQGDTK